MMRSALRLACAASLLATSLHAAQDVYVVDDDAGIGVDFPSIAAAVAAVPTGSVLVVRDGTYGGFELERPMTVLADNDAQVLVHGQVRLRDLPVGSTTTVRGLTLRYTPLPAASAHLELSSCAGDVFLEDLDLSDAAGPLRMRATQCQRLRLSRCRIGHEAPAGATTLVAPAALELIGSSAMIYGGTYRGGDGTDARIDAPTSFPIPASSGAAAIRLVGSSLHLYDADVRGGDGGAGLFHISFGCLAPGNGGAGVSVSAWATLITTGGALSGGAGGAPGVRDVPGWACPASAHDGKPIEQSAPPLQGVVYVPMALQTAGITVSPVQRDIEPLRANIEGQGPVLGAWVIGTNTVPTSIGLGPIGLLVEPLLIVPFVLDASGQATLELPAIGPVLPPGAGIVLHHQVGTFPVATGNVPT
jgi:hypothetical protein